MLWWAQEHGGLTPKTVPMEFGNKFVPEEIQGVCTGGKKKQKGGLTPRTVSVEFGNAFVPEEIQGHNPSDEIGRASLGLCDP